MPERPPDVPPEILAGDLSEDLLDTYLAGPELAVDTETMGLQTRRDRLCLVQLCDRRRRAAIVQLPPETFDARNPRPSRAPRLKRVLEDPRVLKVFHFARFDVAALAHWLGIAVSPLYCTRTASKLARTYTDRHGLKDNLLELLDVELDKVTRHSDWSSPVLTPEQVRYAISDVTLLLPLMDRLEEMLRRQGRADLARECFDAIPTMAKLDVAGFEGLFEH
ncbi:MAG TPA: ribonuclease D [Vicinamibacteria bacterium]|nr:ribonuclease D [Vicinamibacteria bacterium]